MDQKRAEGPYLVRQLSVYKSGIIDKPTSEFISAHLGSDRVQS